MSESVSVKAWLYDSNENYVTYDTGLNSNFHIEEFLDDNDFVYLKVRGSSSQETGLIDVIVEDATLDLRSSSATALSVTEQPFFTGNYYQGAGEEGWLKFTPEESGLYSMLTTGNTDMYIALYNSSLTIKASDNNDGHGSNAMIGGVYLSKYLTYYIKVKGYGSNTTGYFSLFIHRGLPVSTYEQEDLFGYFNSSTYQYYNNCYTYALSMWQHPLTGYKFRLNGQNPGEMSGNSITGSDLSDATTAYNAILTAVQADAAYYGGEINPIDFYEQPQEGFYKVALVLAPGIDYHWYRETENGQWVHKPGMTPATYYDASSELIYNPEVADRNGSINYTVFLGYFEVEAIDLTTTVMMMQSLEVIGYEEEQSYDYKDDLSYEVLQLLELGMEINDVKTIMGEQHGTYGSGLIGFSYQLVDGREIVIYYSGNFLSRIAVLDDGVYTVIKE